MTWTVFLLSATAVIVAGVRLARDGDTIAEKTGLGGMWVGAILVAAATSLPELGTDVSAVWQGAPKLAVGDLFGSNMANMVILAVADLLVRHTRVLARVAVNQLAVGTLAIALAAIATLGMLVPGWTVAGVGWSTIVVGAAYVAGMGYLHRNRAEPPFGAGDGTTGVRPGELRRAALGFAAAAVLIVLAAPFLAYSTAIVADQLGISHGFAGMVLLAATTSMPEAVVTVTSIRAGAYELAVGNLFGSNCFNMAALVALDVADGWRPVLANMGADVVVGALAGILLTSLAMLGILDRADRRRRIVDLGPIAMLGAYVAALAVMHRMPG